jgi:general L-amino acid transport system permease protein
MQGRIRESFDHWRKRETWVDAAYDPAKRGLALQGLLVAVLLVLAYGIVSNTIANLEKQNIASGFDFLSRTAGFDVSQTLIPYSSRSSYGAVFLVGLVNTLLVAALGIVIATVLGFTLGIARLSPNWLASRLALGYVELVRNVPVLLQLLVWYVAVLRALPMPQDAIALPGGAFVDTRGLHLPWLSFAQGLDFPVLGRFNFEGGLTIEPEFLALLTGLSIYTAAFIAEIVRAGLLAVPRGQHEAAKALGLSRWATLRYVVMPQALRVIVPPLSNQYLNLAKNSSLAVAIGYPDLVSVFAGTVLNQTGQAVEVISITMAVYLAISLAGALAMNRLNARLAWPER